MGMRRVIPAMHYGVHPVTIRNMPRGKGQAHYHFWIIMNEQRHVAEDYVKATALVSDLPASRPGGASIEDDPERSGAGDQDRYLLRPQMPFSGVR